MIVWKNALPMKEKINKMVLYPLSILGILFSSTLFLRAQERLGLFDKERITTHRDWLVQKTGTQPLQLNKRSTPEIPDLP